MLTGESGRTAPFPGASREPLRELAGDSPRPEQASDTEDSPRSSGDKPRRRRRSRAHVRGLIIQAAQELFVERGLHGASTRDVAKRADVVEVVIYSNFKTKAKLFDEAVLLPVEARITALLQRWSPHRATVAPVDLYCDELIALLWRDRHLLRTLTATSAYTPELADRTQWLLEELARLTEDLVAPCARGDRLRGRVVFGAVLAPILHDGLLTPPGDPATPELLRRYARKLIAELR